jgi:hypothetical protein
MNGRKGRARWWVLEERVEESTGRAPCASVEEELFEDVDEGLVPADEVGDRAVFEEGGGAFDGAGFSSEIAEAGEEPMPVVIGGGSEFEALGLVEGARRGGDLLHSIGVDLKVFPSDSISSQQK